MGRNRLATAPDSLRAALERYEMICGFDPSGLSSNEKVIKALGSEVIRLRVMLRRAGIDPRASLQAYPDPGPPGVRDD